MPSFPYLTLLISGGHTILVLVHSPQKFELLTPTPTLNKSDKATGSEVQAKDLSIGNAFDKVAKLLDIQPDDRGLGHGAALERFCERNPSQEEEWRKLLDEADARLLDAGDKALRKTRLVFTIPSPGQLRFSYAGLYSEIKQFVERHSLHTPDSTSSLTLRIALAHAFQHTAIDQLEAKLDLALALCERKCQGHARVKDVVISGGVASNMKLRARSV